MSAIASCDVGDCFRSAFGKRTTWFGLLFLVLWTLFVSGCGGDDTTTPPPTTTTTTGMDAARPDTTGGTGGSSVGVDARPDIAVVPDAPPDVAPPGMDAGMDAPPLLALPTPAFAPVSDGGSFAGSVDVTITVAGLPTGGFIYYTNNGTNPTPNSLVVNGPIHLTMTTQLRAYATAPGRLDSPVGSATYTIVPIQIDGGIVASPDMNPMSTTQNNDFTVAITTATPGATICYTLDGSTPSCTGGVCQGTAQTYSAASRVPITGLVTDTTGNATLRAIGCAASQGNSTVTTQNYTLQAAAPTLVSPAPGNLPYLQAGYAPTISSATNPTGTSAVTIRYTTTAGTPPTCNVGTSATNPQTLAAGTVSSAITFYAIACKLNYAPSTVSTNAYTVTLNTPTVAPGTGTYDRATAVTVTDTANLGAADWGCYTTNGTAPACSATANTCTTGTPLAYATAAGARTGTINVTTTGTALQVASCAPAGLISSAASATATYTLQLSEPSLTPPGCAGGSCVTGAPLTSGNIPSNLVGNFHPTVGQTGVVAGRANWDHACFIINGTPVCSAAGCTTGTVIADGAALSGASVVAGNAVSVIGCPGASTAFGQSAVTTVAYSAPGAALAPTITPASGTFNTRLNTANGNRVTITNADATNTLTICWTSNGTAPVCSSTGPTCTTGNTVILAGGASNTPVALDNLQSSNTQVQAVACSTTQAQSAATSVTYNFQVRQPDISLVAKGDLNAGGTLQATQFKISTDSDFTNIQFRFTTGATALSCATGTLITPNDVTAAFGGTSATFTVPAGAMSPLTLNFIGCADATPSGQAPSTVRTATFNLVAATPVFNRAGGTYENTLAAGNTPANPVNISSATFSNGVHINTQICYRTDGTLPSCAAGVCDTNPATLGGIDTGTGINVDVTVSNTRIRAVACTANFAQSALASADYTLRGTAPVVNVVVGSVTCPDTISIFLSQAGTNGGPTRNATICYTTDGVTTPTCTPGTVGGPTNGIICFSSGAVGGSQNAQPLTPNSGPVMARSCRTGFDDSATVTFAYTPAFSQAITVDGNLADFAAVAASTSVPTTTAGTAYVSYNATTAFFGLAGTYTPAATTVVTVYLGIGSATVGTLTGPANVGSPTLPTRATYMFQWRSDNLGGIGGFTSSGTNGPWVAAGTNPTVGYQSGSNVEFSLALAAFGSPVNMTVVGAVVTGVGSAPTAGEGWPQQAAGATYGHYLNTNRNSCFPANKQILP